MSLTGAYYHGSTYDDGVFVVTRPAPGKKMTFKVNVATAPTHANEEISHDQDQKHYREMVGSLVYAMTTTRPDLSWAVIKLSQLLANPDNND